MYCALATVTHHELLILPIDLRLGVGQLAFAATRLHSAYNRGFAQFRRNLTEHLDIRMRNMRRRPIVCACASTKCALDSSAGMRSASTTFNKNRRFFQPNPQPQNALTVSCDSVNFLLSTFVAHFIYLSQVSQALYCK